MNYRYRLSPCLNVLAAALAMAALATEPPDRAISAGTPPASEGFQAEQTAAAPAKNEVLMASAENHRVDLPEQQVIGDAPALMEELTRNDFPIEVRIDSDSNIIPPAEYLFGTRSMDDRSVQVQYAVPEESLVALKVVDLEGNIVTTLIKGRRKPAVYEIQWVPISFRPGEYTLEFSAGEFARKNQVALNYTR